MNNIDEVTLKVEDALNLLKEKNRTGCMSDIDNKTFNRILIDLESAGVSLRMEKEKAENLKRLHTPGMARYRQSNLPVEIKFENNTLRIYLPYTDTYFDKFSNVPLCDYVNMAMREYEEEHGFNSLLHKIKVPYFVIIRKHVTSNTKKYMDNDNFAGSYEVNRIINTINEFTLNPDDWKSMKYVTVLTDRAISDKYGTEIVMFERTPDAIKAHIADFM